MKFVVAAAFALLFLIAVEAPADQVTPDSVFQEKVPLFPNAKPPAPTADAQVALARRLMQSRQFEPAMAILESVYSKDPDDSVVQNLLRSCYAHLSLHAKSELLARALISKHPGVLDYRLYLAESIALQEQVDRAIAVYDTAASMILPGSERDYRKLIRSLIVSGLKEQALTQIGECRADMGNATAFALELGGLYESDGRYSRATEEYLALLREDTTRLSATAERELSELMKFEESAPTVLTTLKHQIDSLGSFRTARLLSEYYLEVGDVDSALAYAQLQDSLSSFSGQALVSFMRHCEELSEWGPLKRVSSYVLGRYDDVKFQVEGHRYLSSAYLHLGQLDSSIVSLDFIVANSPYEPDRAQALYRIGTIYSEYYREYDRALVYFDSVAQHYRRGLVFWEASKAIPHCHLRKGEIAKARIGYERLASNHGLAEIAEEMTYYLGLCDVFEQKYDSAAQVFSKLMLDFPSGYYVNDALQMRLVLTESDASEELLDEYARTMYYQERDLVDSTRVGYLALADNADTTLADIALYRLAGLELEMADSSAALEVLDRLTEDFRESYYRPYGMKMKADILLAEDPASEAARRLYRELLESYSEYPFTSEIRQKLRDLEIG